jgi:hypothetical protein
MIPSVACFELTRSCKNREIIEKVFPSFMLATGMGYLVLLNQPKMPNLNLHYFTVMSETVIVG